MFRNVWEYQTDADGGSLRWLADYQRVLINAFVDIESTGFPFSPKEHKRFILKSTKVYKDLDRSFRRDPAFLSFCKRSGVDPSKFNLNSPQQLREFLFSGKGLGLEPIRYSKQTGDPSTDKGSLHHFAEQGVEIANKLHSIKNFSKILSSFGEPLLKFYSPLTGAVHPNYFLAKVIDEAGKSGGTRSGRLSCKYPNLQQLTNRSEDSATSIDVSGKDVRKSFVPFSGEILAEIDFSQIEVRVAGMYAMDEKMGEFFHLGGDFHTRVAAMVAGYDYDTMIVGVKDENHSDHKRLKTLRSNAKSITFGLLYGMGLVKLLLQSGMTEEEGEEFIKTYFGIFQGLSQWRKDTIELVSETGVVTTLFGRTRIAKMRGYTTEDRREERIGVNTPIQSAASDIVLYGLSRIWEKLVSEGWGTSIIGTIHDSIVFSIPYDEFNRVVPWIVRHMTRPPGLEWLLDNVPIPLDVEVDVGPNFRDMHTMPLEEASSGYADISGYAEAR